MPISEDEYDYNRSQEPQSTMSKAELRKTHKPIMEKRRRARINQCLNEIKTLILEAMNKDPARHSKLEKADILEMAVKHLQNVQRQQLALAMATDPSVLRKFKTGFNECSTEIERYINQMDSVDNSMKQRVSTHLQKCISGIEQVAQLNFPGISNLPFLTGSTVFTAPQTQSETQTNAGDQNNNPRIQIPQGIQLIPSRLPSGELALLVPNSSNIPYFPTAVSQNVNQRTSAFAAVVPQSTATESAIVKPISPPVSPVPQDEARVRNPSPQGFRPVVSKQRNYSDDHQVPQISSTVSSAERQQFPQPLEVKPLKFPIHKYAEKERRAESPKKVVEPLCIITNQAERYKQAQMKDDSVNYEENVVYQGVKRKFQEVSQGQGLLTIAQHDFCYGQPSKIIKIQSVTVPTDHRKQEEPAGSSTSSSLFRVVPKTHVSQKDDKTKKEEQPSGSKDNRQPSGSRDTSCEGNCDMWRPW